MSYTKNQNLNLKIEGILHEVSQEIARIFSKADLEAIVLGGGYGRGEGGIFMKNGEAFVYNDLDCFLVLNNVSWLKKRAYHKAVQDLSEQLTSKIGIDVDFTFPINVRDIQKVPPNLMWYELKQGHKVPYGDPDILHHYPYGNISDVPQSEFSRLILNRGVGLLLAKEKLFVGDFTQQKSFIIRNIHKAIQAFGDTVLKLNNCYSTMLEERKAQSTHIKHPELYIPSDFQECYVNSLSFKEMPNLDLDKESTLNLYHYIYDIYHKNYIELIELGLDQTHPGSFQSKLRMQPKGKIWKNILLNLRSLGVVHFLKNPFKFHYPRVYLYYLYNEIMFLNNKEKESVFLKVWEKHN
jgi:hypothetical protein